MSKKLNLLALAVGLALTVSISPAFAAKGGNAAGSGSGSSIAIATVNGGLSAASTSSQSLKLGDALTFATTVERLAGGEYPLVALSCYQDVNGDGVVDMSVVGPDIVYSWLDSPSVTFPLGGNGWSLWQQRGGAATCHAELYAYGWKAGQESIRFLASTASFAAAS